MQKFRLIIFDKDGNIQDILESNKEFFFRSNGSFVSQIRKQIIRVLQWGGYFSFGPAPKMTSFNDLNCPGNEGVIGWQVCSGEGEYPARFPSYLILPLSKAIEIQRQDVKKWRLLPIYLGDIEDPAFFEDTTVKDPDVNDAVDEWIDRAESLAESFSELSLELERFMGRR